MIRFCFFCFFFSLLIPGILQIILAQLVLLLVGFGAAMAPKKLHKVMKKATKQAKAKSKALEKASALEKAKAPAKATALGKAKAKALGKAKVTADHKKPAEQKEFGKTW